MQDAAANFGDSIQGIREAQRLASRQAEQDKITKAKFDQEQTLGGLQIGAFKRKDAQDVAQAEAGIQAQGFADEIAGFGTAVPDSAISLPGMQTMQSPRPIMDPTADNVKDRLRASMENSIAKSQGKTAAFTAADIKAMRDAENTKASRDSLEFESKINKTKAETNKTNSEIGQGRFSIVGLGGDRVGVLNTRTGEIKDSGEKGPSKTGGANDKIVANKGEVLIPDLEPIQGVQITHDSVKKTKEGYSAYQSFKNQLDTYKDLVKKQGSELVGEKADRAAAMITDLAMKLKNLQDLGVLNGKDWELMMKQLPASSGVGPSVKGKIYSAFGADAFGPQLDVLSTSMDDKFNVFARTNGFKKAANSGSSGSWGNPAPSSKFKILSVE
jgi:hypothetical protein